jgi:hypothetical protein
MRKSLSLSFAGLTIALGGVLVAAGCSSSAPPAPINLTGSAAPVSVASAPGPAAQVDASAIVSGLPLRADGNAYTYTARTGQTCHVAMVIVNANMLKTYQNAGDNVATNPSKTAGVKIVDDEAKTCNQLLTAALARF